MFTNAKQSIPQLFKEKMGIDNSLQSFCKVASVGFLDSQKKWQAFRDRWYRTKERQVELRNACEKFLGDAKKG